MQLPQNTLEYVLDQDNIILAIGGAWDGFAAGNNGNHLTADRVIGQPLLNFISGKVTKQLWLDIFGKVRIANASANIDFRCDAPTEKRFMRMTVKPEAHGQLRITCQLLRQEPIARPVLITCAKERSKQTLVRCSLCNRINHQNIWQEAGQLASAQGRGHWLVVYGICPACQETLANEMEALVGG